MRSDATRFENDLAEAEILEGSPHFERLGSFGIGEIPVVAGELLREFETAVLVDSGLEEVETNRSPARLGDVDTELFACHFWATAHGHVMLDICGLGAEVHAVDHAGRSPEHQYVDSITAAIRGFQVHPPPV
jgi:hypothetical protein